MQFRPRGRRNIIQSRMEYPKCHGQIATGLFGLDPADGMSGMSWRSRETGQWCVVAFHEDDVVTGTEPRTELWKRFWSRWAQRRRRSSDT
jgi:hypothetical protein